MDIDLGGTVIGDFYTVHATHDTDPSGPTQNCGYCNDYVKTGQPYHSAFTYPVEHYTPERAVKSFKRLMRPTKGWACAHRVTHITHTEITGLDSNLWVTTDVKKF
jgi:hypothetical protein